MTEIDFQSRPDRPVYMALGFFDSVHYGHRRIIERVKTLAVENGAASCVFTFSNNAYKQFNPQSKLIYIYPERAFIMAGLGIDYLFSCPFDKAFKDTDRRDFLDSLTSVLDVKGFVCGYDYLFGAGGAGDTEYLAAYCREKGIALEVVPEITLDGVRVSSTGIKAMLTAGDIAGANRMLAEPYLFRAKVTRGRGTGHLHGYPTINLYISHAKHIIKHGVYKTETELNGRRYRSVTNIGTKPTFGDATVSVESFLDGYDGDAYDAIATVRFTAFLREIRAFSSPDELGEQIRSDLRR